MLPLPKLLKMSSEHILKKWRRAATSWHTIYEAEVVPLTNVPLNVNDTNCIRNYINKLSAAKVDF